MIITEGLTSHKSPYYNSNTGAGSTTYTYSGTYPTPTQIKYKSSLGEQVTVQQTGTYRLESSASYVNVASAQQTLKNSDEYSTYAYDEYGNCILERHYISMPEGQSEGIYRSLAYAYGGYLGNNAVTGLYCISVMQNDVLTDRYTYDIMGRERTHTDGENHLTSKEYNPAGKISRIAYPDGSIERFAYTPFSNSTTYTNQTGGQYIYDFNVLGDIQAIKKADGTILERYTYDRIGKLKKKEILPETDYALTTDYWYSMETTTTKIYAGEELLSQKIEKLVDDGIISVKTYCNEGALPDTTESVSYNHSGEVVRRVESVGYPHSRQSDNSVSF